MQQARSISPFPLRVCRQARFRCDGSSKALVLVSLQLLSTEKVHQRGVGVVLVEGSLNQKKGFDFELIRMLSKDVTPCWLSQIPAGIKRVVLQIETSWDTLAPRNKCESFDFTAAAVTAWNLVMPHFCDDGGALSFTSNEMGQLFYMLAARKLAESVGSSE
jgi:hypothetical protein